jgi:hypothetical protein
VSQTSAVSAITDVSNGTIIDAAAFHSEPIIIDTGKSVGAYSGLWVRGGAVNGSLSNNYGVRVDPLLAGTNRYGLYITSDPTFLGGTLTVEGEVSGAGVTTTSAANKLVKTNSSGKIDAGLLDITIPTNYLTTTGDGSGLTSLNASSLASGTVPATRGGAGSVNGILKANGTGSVSQAVAGTDYLTPTGNGSGLTSLNAANLTAGTVPATRGGAGSVNGILKANGTGSVSQAAAGTDYLTPAGNGSQLTALNASNLASGTVAAARMPAFTGDATSSSGTATLTIANNAVSNVKAADMPATTLKGNNTLSSADPKDLTVTEVKALLAISQPDVAGLTTSSSPSFAGVTAASYTGTGIATTATADKLVKTNGSGKIDASFLPSAITATTITLTAPAGDIVMGIYGTP